MRFRVATVPVTLTGVEGLVYGPHLLKLKLEQAQFKLMRCGFLEYFTARLDKTGDCERFVMHGRRRIDKAND